MIGKLRDRPLVCEPFYAVLRAGFYDTLRGLPRRFGVDVTTGTATSRTSILDLAGGSSNRFVGTRVSLLVVVIGCIDGSSSQGSGTVSNSSGSVAGAATSGCGCSMDAGIDTGVEGSQDFHK